MRCRNGTTGGMCWHLRLTHNWKFYRVDLFSSNWSIYSHPEPYPSFRLLPALRLLHSDLLQHAVLHILPHQPNDELFDEKVCLPLLLSATLCPNQLIFPSCCFVYSPSASKLKARARYSTFGYLMCRLSVDCYYI